MSFLYSRGIDTFDNAPAQMVADSFSDFTEAVADRIRPRVFLVFHYCFIG
jgi:hypothetical protein